VSHASSQEEVDGEEVDRQEEVDGEEVDRQEEVNGEKKVGGRQSFDPQYRKGGPQPPF
jgi:hypothetical protein